MPEFISTLEPESRDLLQRAAEGLGRVDSYVGDDGRIYLA